MADSSFVSMRGFGFLFALALLILAAPVHAEDWQKLGRDALVEGHTDQAEKYFSEAARMNPFDAVALNNKAVVKARQGQYHVALRLLERASHLAPQRIDISYNLKLLKQWLLKHGFRKNVETVAGNFERGAAVVLPPEPPALWR